MLLQALLPLLSHMPHSPLLHPHHQTPSTTTGLYSSSSSRPTPLQDPTMDSSRTTPPRHSPSNNSSSSNSPVWFRRQLPAPERPSTPLCRTHRGQEAVSTARWAPCRAPPRPECCPPKWVHRSISTTRYSQPPQHQCSPGTARVLPVRGPRSMDKEAQVCVTVCVTVTGISSRLEGDNFPDRFLKTLQVHTRASWYTFGVEETFVPSLLVQISF